MHINWAEMEKKRQTKRESEHIYHTSEDPQKEKFYVLDMFPYPSGAGLHVGHPKGYIATDTLARKKMLEGFSVLHPMGFDTFGLGTEQYAIDNKMKPQDVAKTNIDNFKKQLAKMGFSYDWERSFSTADPDYYRRTQRIFLQLYTHYYDEEKKQARPLYELLKKRLLEIYDIATIKKEYKSGRSKDNPTYGQCIPTALLVQSLFGGEVYKLEQDNHYYNVINGEIVDLTKDQFNYELDYTVGIKRTMIFDEEALQRYELLKEKLGSISSYLDKHRLAYIDYKPINRCPHCKTGLANEDLEDGRCERCGSEVEQRPMRQRVLRITTYADRLLEGLEQLDWDESMKELERNRIGKSSGTQFKMDISRRDGSGNRPNGEAVNNERLSFEVFTTRIDTVFGMSFVVMAPEHPLVDQITTDEYREKVKAYQQQAKYKTQLERTELQKEKTGQFTGAYAINPFNGEEVPIFIGDYVLANYGTGVVMAVPAHDERDFEFAKKYDIPIVQSIAPFYSATHSEANIRKDKPTITRDVVYAIIYNPETDKYLILNNLTGEAGQSFIVGGIETGEDSIECGIREIQEETGYQHLKHIRKIDGEVHANFYAIHKDENRYAKAVAHLYELEDETQTDINEKERNRHELLRLNQNEINIRFGNQTYFWKAYLEGESAYCEKGVLVNSGAFSGLTSDEAIKAMQTWLQERNLGGEKHNYKIQDWVFSRQRYRGEPFPIVFCPEHGTVAMDESALPLTLPDVENYEPTGREEGPLDDVKWRIETPCPICGKPAKRESNTMPGWAGSSWYRIRYMDTKNDQALVDKDKEAYRGNVDVYVGGAEHVTRHMIYARFWQKFLYDIGIVSQQEPFQKYEKVGLIMAEDGRKMSKRRGNVVNPDDVIAEYGADAFRMYEMFMGPFDQSISRNTNGLKGVKKFLDKVVALWDKVDPNEPRRDAIIGSPNGKAVNSTNHSTSTIPIPKPIETLLHQTIKKTTEDIDNFRFNTTISQFMILANALSELETIDAQLFETFIILLAPFAPHIAEEFRNLLGHPFSIFTTAQRPQRDETKLTSSTITLAIQFNGKVRGTLDVSPTANEEEVLTLIKSNEKLNAYLTSGEMKKVIYVPGKIMNIVVN